MITKKKKQILACAVLLAASFAACRKDVSIHTVPPKAAVPRNLNDSRQLLADIQHFYQRMQTIRDGMDNGANIVAIDEAEFLTEATYNYYVARNDYKAQSVAVNISIPEPMTNGGILMKDVTDAFWQIKAKLLDAYNKIDFDGKHLAQFDLKLNVGDGGTVSFDAYTTITTGSSLSISGINTGGVQKVDGAANHAWNVRCSAPPILQGTPNPGQCDLNMVDGTLIGSPNTTLPNGSVVLRQLGVSNYWGGNPPVITTMIGYMQTITREDMTNNPNSAIGWPISDYNNQHIHGYINSRIWSCDQFYNVAGTTDHSDLNEGFKTWLTTANLNFYLSFIPAIITECKNNLVMPPNSGLTPASYTLSDLSVVWATNFAAQQPEWPFFLPHINQRHQYKITYGVVTNIPLPPVRKLGSI